MKKILALFSGLLFSTPFLFSQTPATLSGLVTNERDELLVGASIYWSDTKTGTMTDTAGRFTLPARKTEATLIVQYPGYAPTSVQVLPEETSIWIEVQGVAQLSTVTISGHGFGNAVSTLDPRNVESIGRHELRKAPCCNLSESFETNGTVDVAYPNALTGVKEIQMLGLRGLYSQFMLENRPALGGIAAPFAFELVPGTWLSGIQLAKGASTVKNGPGGISGQINAELVKPAMDKPVFVNAFGSSEGRGELNLHLNKKGKINNGLLLHGSFVENRWDQNGDNFYDSPNRHQLNGLYRAFYESPKWCAQFNLQALTDRRQSGQIDALDGSPAFFAIDQQNDRVEAWGKLGREGLFGKPYNQIGNILSATWHETDALYGPNHYAATQRSLYWQSLYQTIIGTTDHQLVIAPSLQYDDVQEKVNDSALDRKEALPGTMVEYTYSRPNLEMGIPDLVLVLGMRGDWNSRYREWWLTPRGSLKYNFSQNSVVRLSAGRGYRSPYLVAENISLLASNRALVFGTNLGAEEAWNYGVNYTQNFKVARRQASFSVDLYRTDFMRQIIVDVEQDLTEVSFYNLDGKSFANSALASLQYNPLPGFDVKLAYKWQDTRATYADGRLRTLPYVARYRGLITLDYTTPKKHWAFNTRLQIVGPQRLPEQEGLPEEYAHHQRSESPAYAILNAQITRSWKRLEVYAGGENLTGYRQHEVIVAANDPGSVYFDGSRVWAPMMGAVGYVGLRWSLGEGGE